MARKLKLQWHKASKRWRKKYKGKDFYFAYGTNKGDMAGYEQALAEWEKKLAELEPNDPPPIYKHALATYEKMRQWFNAHNHEEINARGARETQAKIDLLKSRLEKPNPPDLDQSEAPLYGVSEQGTAIWYDRFREIDLQAKARPRENTLAYHIQSFLDDKQSDVNIGKLSIGRKNNYRIWLDVFARWYKAQSIQSIQEIDSQALLAYKAHLSTLISKGKMKPSYAADLMTSVGGFIKFLYIIGLIDLPRVMATRKLAITIPDTTPIIFTDEEVKSLITNAKPKMKLKILLMINCGYYQGDISDLKQSQVDWEQGRIKRKRSKMETNANTPEINYPLWSETFNLLQFFRSKDKHYALLNNHGKPLKTEKFNAKGNYIKSDCFARSFRILAKKLGISKPPKCLRKTSASKLGTHKEYKFYAQYFLGHKPDSIADNRYVIPSQDEFDLAVKWLGRQWGIN